MTVEDISLIPHKFLVVDESSVKAAFRAGETIPGVKCEYEQRTRF